MKAVIKACGATLTDWSISAEGGRSYVKVDCEDDYSTKDEDEDGCATYATKDSVWMLREILTPLGYVNESGAAYFPGLCVFTGVCYDDDFIESVYKSLASGETLTDALRGLADEASKRVDESIEQECNEESMLANWGDDNYTREGIKV